MRLFAALLLAALLACRPATIDGSSREATEASLEEIRQQLSFDDQVRLKEALRTIVVRELGNAMRAGFDTTSAAHVDRRVTETLDGKTAEEVIAHAQALRAERSGHTGANRL